ncbi:MAG TPA: response regulator [Candidatus Paceibacterota bacterium]|nr:response regulator [Candidatus Paceibacterota bacterium]
MDEKDKIKKAVLLVEDDSLLLALYSAKLKKDGFEVIPAHTCGEGLAAIKQHEPDLIVLDLKMPDMPGLEFLKILREDPKTQNIKVVIITSSDREEDRICAEKLGVSEYYIKSESGLEQLGNIIKDNAK